LTPDLSQNNLIRAYTLAKIVQKRYEVEIVGPIFGDGIWKPFRKLTDVEYKFVKVKGELFPYLKLQELARKISGDIIYASKPLFTSFLIGLMESKKRKNHLILDIDDWELGFVQESLGRLTLLDRLMSLGYSAIFPYKIGSYWNRFFCEKLVPLADEITVSNSFLHSKFGGIIVWQGRDKNIFDPRKFKKELLREKYDLDRNKKIVIFSGTPRPYKGVEDLIKAVSLIRDPNILLLVVGVGKDEYSQKLVRVGNQLLGKKFMALALQSFEKVPELLALSDVVAIPQKLSSSTIGQVPAKVFDAMAMAKPTISTAVSDLPEILDECGWIVKPTNSKQLADAIHYVINNSEEAEKMGWKARQKFVKNYSWDAMADTLLAVFKKYE
jgi:glycosyltransferase involved in cell wall biosynthesis